MPTNTPAAPPVAPSPPDRHAAQRDADRELCEQLRADGFEGPRFDLLQERLWLYGWNVLRSWMREGVIVQRCRERRIYFAAPYTEVEEMMRRAEVREDIAIDCLAKAVPAFMSDVLPQWDPDKGRSLDGYFLHLALYHFRDAYRRWAAGHRRRLGAILGPDKIWVRGRKQDMVYDEEHEVWELIPAPAPGPEEQTVLRETLNAILAEASQEERAVCEAMLTTGATQEEIAQQLGTTRKSVERRLSRVRRRARKLAAASLIVVPSVSPAVTR